MKRRKKLKILIIIKAILNAIRPIFFFGLGFFIQQMFQRGVFPVTAPYIGLSIFIGLVAIILFFILDESLDKKIDKI